MKTQRCLAFGALLAMVFIWGCGGGGWDPTRLAELREGGPPAEVGETIRVFKGRDASMKVFFDEAYGYAVFPEVTTGAVGLGAAYGEGYVFEKGKLVGMTTLTKGSIGVQLGGQKYHEIVFFKDKATLDEFMRGEFALSADASAVATNDGAGARTAYSKGVAIFVLGRAGMMFEAAVGGQKFTYTPL